MKLFSPHTLVENGGTAVQNLPNYILLNPY
jgi:hypothetical protein